MHIGIIGIGGIGGYIGSKLCAAYSNNSTHKITFIQRGSHGSEIKKNGLTYIGKTTETYRPTAVYESIENAGIFDSVILCTKSRDLEQTIQGIIPHIHAETSILTLLNGVNNAQRIQKIIPENRILQGCIYVSASIEKPGFVKQVGGAGKVFFGPEHESIQEKDTELQSVFSNANIPTVLTEKITIEVWKKYLFISTFATITSRYNKPIGVLVRDPKHLEETKILLTEMLSVAHALSIDINEHDAENVIDLAFKIPEQTRTSMQLDVYGGKKTEIDILTYYIIQKAEETNISVPLHTEMYTEIIKIINSQQ
ncbi:MAG: 2-dehydropantoate 2-reductase [Bacteroidales bacterium]|jgi:2-dehydropantoate 2-reductase|nr:2-dehydropantoate 2-reductase [Bacteroidales bacterium]